jgi:hypothetical protein
MTGVSAFAILAFLAAAPVAAPVAVEPLFGMRLARRKSSENGGGGEEQQEQCARRKTLAAEWGGLVTPALSFLFHL